MRSQLLLGGSFLRPGWLYHLLDAIEDAVRDTDGEVPVSGAVKEAFMVFVCNTHAMRFSRNLCSLILEFSTTDDAGSAPYWKDLFLDLSNLFRLLDVIEVERRELQRGI